MDEPVTPLLAALDLGSNSFRLELGQLRRGRYRRVDYLKETVRLGAGLDDGGVLREDALQRGLDCLQRFAGRLAKTPPAQLRAVATQTLREARNRDDFLRRAQQVLGHPVEVISGREEARLIYAGVSQLQPSRARRLVIDIGGRSTEMILGQGRVPAVAESFRVGSVSLSMRFFADGRFSAAAFRAAQVAAGAELEEGLRPFARGGWDEALGASGTVDAVAQLLAAAGVSDGRITAEGLRWCIERCLEAGDVQRLQLAGLKEDRRPVIAGGLALLYTLLVQFGIEVLHPAEGALRQGVIADMHRRARPRAGARADTRDASVRELQRRFAVDRAQARRVAKVALRLLGQLGGDAAARRELGWACALHEVGLRVSHHDHHRHSAYLLGHVDAPGFSHDEQRRLAGLVLGQRGGLRKLGPLLDDPAFAHQVLALRLAVLQCHARQPVDEKALRLAREGAAVRVGFDAAWAAAHPRTLFRLREEAAAWHAGGPLALRLDD